jgi:hypothetical protein
MNKGCPSYDCGICSTFPTPYEVKCGDEETKNCKWLNFDFYGTKYATNDEKPKRTMFDYLKSLSVADFAYTVAFDTTGECRGVCAICQRHFDGNCDDRCYVGIIEYLESEVKQ